MASHHISTDQIVNVLSLYGDLSCTFNSTLCLERPTFISKLRSQSLGGYTELVCELYCFSLLMFENVYILWSAQISKSDFGTNWIGLGGHAGPEVGKFCPNVATRQN